MVGGVVGGVVGGGAVGVVGDGAVGGVVCGGGGVVGGGVCGCGVVGCVVAVVRPARGRPALRCRAGGAAIIHKPESLGMICRPDIFLARFEDGTLRVDPATGVIYTKFIKGARKGAWRKLYTLSGGPSRKHEDYQWVRVWYRPHQRGRLCMAVHRAVWMWATGASIPPNREIDHADRRPSNNRLDNLRLVDLFHGKGEPEVIYDTGLDIIQRIGMKNLRLPPAKRPLPESPF